MVQFSEVLDWVRSVLTWASSFQVQALLDGLVEERIISEVYRKNLGLQRLTEGNLPELVDGELPCNAGCNELDWTLSSLGLDEHQLLNQEQMSPEWTSGLDPAVGDHCMEDSDFVSFLDEPTRTQMSSLYEDVHSLDTNLNEELLEGSSVDRLNMKQWVCSKSTEYDFSLRFSDENAELLICAEPKQKPVSDSERVKEGNLGSRREWLEQVEEAARRIAVPLWQHWNKARGMLQAVIPIETDFFTSDIMVSDCEAHYPVWDVEDKMEFAGSCRSPVAHLDDSFCVEATFPADGKKLEGLHFSTIDMDELYADHVRILGAAGDSPVEACADAENGITDMLEGHFDVFWTENKTVDAMDYLLCSTTDAQLSTNSALPERHLLASDASTDTKALMQDYHLNSETGYSTNEGLLDGLGDDSRVACSLTPCCVDGLKDNFENMDSLRDANMQEFDPELFNIADLIPEDLSEYLDDSYLDPNLLLNGLGLCCTDENTDQSDAVTPFEVPDSSNHNKTKIREQTKKSGLKRKKHRVSQSQRCTRAKKPKTADQPVTLEANAEVTVAAGPDAGSVPAPAESLGEPLTPPPLVQVCPPQQGAPIPLQFITIPDNSGYQVVQLSSSPPPPLIRLPFPNMTATPTYIFVPATPPPCRHRVPPHSPVDSAVAPVSMSSFPPGSLSDTASQAMSPPYASPASPSNEVSPCKEPPKSPTVVEIPQGVKDYIQRYKTHMAETCQAMEGGLTLTSHYVTVQVSRREIVRLGKNSNKCLDKELIITGDIDRQKSSVGHRQIFESLNGEMSKRYILLFGKAGMGKTTLIKKLCLDWSKDCIPQFDFVFVLDGKQLTLTEPVYSLQTLLLSLSSFASPCMDPEGVYAQILAAPKRVLIVFDGFEELRDYELLLQTLEKDLGTSLQKDSKVQSFTIRQLFSAILQRVLLPGCTLLLATRPKGAASQLLRRADSFLEVSGFSTTNVEMYLSKYFTDSELRKSALDCLKSSSYLHLLCWNPGLCHLVCMVLEQSNSSEALPRTLTGLCHQVICLKMEKDRRTLSPGETQTPMSEQSDQKILSETSNSSNARGGQKNNPTSSRGAGCTTSRGQRAKRVKKQEKQQDKVDKENDCEEADRELLSQLSSLAWEGVKSNKSNSSVLPMERIISAKLKAFGLRTGLLVSQRLRTKPLVTEEDGERGGKEEDGERGGKEDTTVVGGREEGENKENRLDLNIIDDCDNLLLWANPFLQSYMAAVHLCLSRTVQDRSFIQNLPFQTSAKGRRKPQREEFELTQHFVVGLLFHNRTELQRLHSYTENVFRDMVASKQALVTKHLEGLSFSDLSPAQILEVCNYVYEASFTHEESSGETGSRMLTHLAANLPELLTFRGVPLSPPDVFTVQNALERGGAEGRSFCLDLEDSGIQICGLRALAGLNNINTYRACIADVVTLWEQLAQSGENGFLQGAVSKFKIHPLKATQVCHIEHLEKLVSIHVNKKLLVSSSQSDSILAEGVPAVRELYKLEFELGPEKGPLALPKLWGLLPGLQNLQHLDLEKSKIEDKGAEKLAKALVSLGSLEILNLSQNCIGDEGVKKLALALKDLPKLHCLSLYSNVISDEGAESLAAALPHMASLTELDVKYNKIMDVGAQSLGASLRNCKNIKTLRMWNQYIPCGVFERLQQQDSRIPWH